MWVTVLLLLTQLVHFLSGKKYTLKKIKEKSVVLPASDTSNVCLASKVVAEAKQMLA